MSLTGTDIPSALPKNFADCRDRWLSLQRAGYHERINRPITPSLIALDVLIAIWSFSTRRNLLSNDKVIELEKLIENALNGMFNRGKWVDIFNEVADESVISAYSLSKKNQKSTIEEQHLTKAFILLGQAIDYSIDAMEVDSKGEPTALNLALIALSVSSEFIGMLHGIKDYRQKISKQPRPKTKPTNKSLTMQVMRQWKNVGRNFDDFIDAAANSNIDNFELEKGIKFDLSWSETKEQKLSPRTLQDWWTDC